MNNCFIYCRQSVGASDPDDSMSLDVQKEECLRLSKAKGLKVLEVFREPNLSGRLYPEGYEALANIDSTFKRWAAETKKTGQCRPQLGKMLKRLDEVDFILVYDLTRLHRSLRGSFLENLIVQELNSHKVKVLTVKEGELDFSRFTDALVTSLTSQISSEQLAIMKEKSKASMKALKERGEWSGECFKSFGYRTTGRRREVEIDEDKAEIVRTIYKMYAEGASYWEISKAVNPIVWEKWHKTLFKAHMFRILRNPIYIGYYKCNGQLVKSKPNEGKEIVPFRLWKAAQEVYEHRVIHPKRDYRNWLPLSGKVVCGLCGEGMRACRANKRFIQYRCFSYSKHGLPKSKSCKNGANWMIEGELPQEGDALVDSLMGLLPIYYFHKLEVAEAEGAQKGEEEELQVSLLNLRGKAKVLMESFLEGLVDEAAYKAGLATVKKQMKEASDRLDELKLCSMDGRYDSIKLLADLEALNAGDADKAELAEAFRWAFKKVELFPLKAVVETPLGGVELPIKAIGQKHMRLLPFHFIAAGNGECDVIYHWEGREVKEAPDYQKDGQLIGDFGKVKVWIV